ncbi:1-propanol dehydrogenase PduQ [Dethiothermospora halolimnae]|uniref:1-propanol dehydrogenase PduQ n=1 Tax=Dethiothermospora halolimnae TaxID=3114390 RepID=UPI003CCBFABC
MKKFQQRTKVQYGIDSVKYLNEITEKRVYIVTDEFMIKFGLVEKATEILDSNKIEYKIFDKVKPDPSLDLIKKGLKNMMEYRPDLLLAIGGGSSIDAAKAMLYFNIKTAEEIVDRDNINKPTFIAIPTTSGTGSEVTSYSVITDKEKNLKIPLVDDIMVPDVAIIDCEFTKSVPPSVTGDTGMDVLTHALEAYVAKDASDYTDVYSEKAIKNVFSYLIRAYDDGNDMEAREKLHFASCMAGIAFNNAGLGINHSLAHSLGAKFKLSHGRANAILLPYVIEYNSGIANNIIDNITKKYSTISKILGLPSSNCREGVISLIEAIKVINKRLNIPICIKEVGIDRDEFEESIEDISSKAIEDICTLGNPRSVTKKELKGILKRAY